MMSAAMHGRLTLIFLLTTMPVPLACAPAQIDSIAPAANGPAGVVANQAAGVAPDVLQSLHVRLVVHPDDGDVEYLGWYDGRRNLLGPGGISAALVGIEPPELRGKLTRVSANELQFDGVDQNQIAWQKRYRLTDSTVAVTYRVTNRRDQAFDAIVFSLADLPDSTIKGDNRDLYVESPQISAHFRARLDNPNFPGEQMNLSAMRSDSRRLEPGDSMEFQMTWELIPKRRQ
jgi:hypothetical protein